MKILMTFLLFFLAFNVHAKPWAKVTLLKGNVLFEKEQLAKGDAIRKSGNLVVGKRSVVKIFVKKWGATIIVGPNSKMFLNLSDNAGASKYTFLKGTCRWKSLHTDLKRKIKNKGGITTPNAAMAIRGTDFVVTYQPLWQETELVVLDGSVMFKGLNNQSKDIVRAGEWKAVGGRFGSNGSKVVKVPSVPLKYFEKKLNF